jgi:SAM-dependent methyltransferase
MPGSEKSTRLPPDALRRIDESPDAEFYRPPRLVHHIDDCAIAAVTRLYGEYFPAGSTILDLMSSWVSHLPAGTSYQRVAGLGMNAEELKTNPRLTDWIVHDLNADPRLTYGNDEFDGCGICVSIDYLIHPVEVLREVARVLKPGAPLVITFSDRCFATKAVRIWNELDGNGKLRLVCHYLEQAGGYEIVRADRLRSLREGDPLWAVVASKSKPTDPAPHPQ